MTRLSIIAVATILGSCLISVAEDSPIASSQISSDNSPATVTAAKKRGAETAAKDIKNGTFRILHFGKPMSADKPLVDETTGYRIQVVGGCVVTAPFVAEVEAYNATMQQWHAKEKAKATSK